MSAKELANSVLSLAEDHLAQLDTPATVPDSPPWWQFL